MSSETFALRFKEAREKKNITIKALQPLVGASPSALNGYATGKTLPPLEVAIRIAQGLDVSLDWLCGLRDDVSDNGQMTTGKLVRILSCLLTTQTSIKPNKKAAHFDKWNDGSVTISIDQEDIPAIMDFASWASFMALYSNGTIEDEMYSAWLEKKAKELDSVVLPVTETDELPF